MSCNVRKTNNQEKVCYENFIWRMGEIQVK